MAVDTIVPRSRRALLGATLGALAGAAVSTLARPNPAAALDGDTVKVGGSFSGTKPTAITNTAGDAIQAINSATSASGLFGSATASTGATYGVFGRSNSSAGTGVAGVNYRTTGTTYGLYGRVDSQSGYAIFGENPGAGSAIRGEAPGGVGVTGYGKPGVWGQASAADAAAVLGRNLSNSGSGSGVEASTASPTGRGVYARAVASGCGVMALSDASSAAPVPTTPAKTGVYGRATQDANARGVHGYSTAGRGVYGQATAGRGVYGYASAASGVGVYAASAAAASAALQVSGVAKFSRSGKLTVTAGSTQATKTGVALTSSSLVLATIQGVGESGVYVRAVLLDTAGSSFTVRLSKAPTASRTVAWFVVN